MYGPIYSNELLSVPALTYQAPAALSAQGRYLTEFNSFGQYQFIACFNRNSSLIQTS